MLGLPDLPLPLEQAGAGAQTRVKEGHFFCLGCSAGGSGPKVSSQAASSKQTTLFQKSSLSFFLDNKINDKKIVWNPVESE